MYFIYIINDIEIGKKRITAERIMDILLKNNHWVYGSFTPNLRNISQGDKILIYLAGKGRRRFVVKFEISGGLEKYTYNGIDEEETFLYSMFNLETPIESIEYFEDPVEITQIKDELEFITDKRNYGLFLRQSVKVIEEVDYLTIIKKSMVNNVNYGV